VRGAIVSACVAHAAMLALSCRTGGPMMRTALAASAELQRPVAAGVDRDATEREANALLGRFAPTFLQRTSTQYPERDRPLRVDFDGDWDARNNWAHLGPRMAKARPAVYGSAILTATHGYLTYTLFYPRDWATPFCLPYVCHDNDLEVALVVITRPSGADPDGRLSLVETKAHNEYRAIGARAVARSATGGPMIEVESGGHGMRPMTHADAVTGPGLVTFVPAAGARGGETYELLSLHATLWARRSAAAESGALWAEGESGFLSYYGERYGRRGALLGASMEGREYPGGVRPPWGLRAGVGERGDWFLDPAFVTRTLHGRWFDGAPPSLVYELNPYLEDLDRECAGAACAQGRPATRGASPVGWGSAFLFLLGFVAQRWPRADASAARRAWPRWLSRRTRARAGELATRAPPAARRPRAPTTASR
jgi:hypothetical protein